MERHDLTEKLPREIMEDGAKLYRFKDEDKVKYIITNTKRNYRSFIYISKERRESDVVNDLYDAYRSDNFVYSETQLYSMGVITKRGAK